MIENSSRGEEIGVAASVVFRPASDAGISCSLHQATSICYETLRGFHSRSMFGASSIPARSLSFSQKNTYLNPIHYIGGDF